MATLDDVVSAVNQLGKDMKNQSGPDREARRTESLADTEERIKLLQEELKLEEDLVDQAEKSIQLTKAKIEANNLSTKTAKEKAEANKALTAQLKKQTEQLKDNTKAQDDNEGAADAVMGSLQALTGVSNDFSKSLVGQTVEILKNAKAQEKLKKKLKETYTTGNMLASMFEKLGQGTLFFGGKGLMEVQQGLADFNKSGGMLARFGGNIASVSAEVREFGVTAGDLGASINALGRSFPLSRLDKGYTKIAQNFAVLEKFGVSAQTSAEAFTSLSRGLKLSQEDAANTVDKIARLGVELGMGAGTLVDDFKNALPRLAIYGNNATKIFKNIASASSDLGISVSDVIDIAEGFQTFEGAAQAAGKLNAIIGGGFVDQLALMRASYEDPVEAMNMIKKAFERGGKSISTMGPAMVKAAAAAAGFNDVDKFRRFMNGEISAKQAMDDESQSLQVKATQIAAGSQTFLQRINDSIQKGTNAILANILKALGGQDAVVNAITSQGPGTLAALGIGGALAPSLLTMGGAALLGKFGLKGLGKVFGKNTPKPPGGGFTNFSAPKTPTPGTKNFAKIPPGLATKSAKTGGKFLLKKIPVLGALLGAGFALKRLSQGDYVGAALEATAGLASTVPGYGTAAAIAIEGGLIARDMSMANNPKPADSSMPTAKQVASTSTTTGSGPREVKHVIEIVQNTPQAEQFVTAVYRADLSSTAIG